MRLFVVGANGQTGRHVVEQALTAGHEVTAVVRRDAGLPTRQDQPRLTTVVGDAVHDRPRMAQSLTSHDAVICALGNGLLIRHGRRPKIMETAVRTLTGAMVEASVSRLVVMLSYGSAATAEHAPLAVRLLGATLLRTDFADLAAADAVLAASGLDWTVCHFGSLSAAPPTGRTTVDAALGRPAHYVIPRADLAAVLLAQATTGDHRHSRVVVSGPGRG